MKQKIQLIKYKKKKERKRKLEREEDIEFGNIQTKKQKDEGG